MSLSTPSRDSVGASIGLEDTAIALAIDAGLIDLSPTTSLSVDIGGLPAEATLSAGTDNGDGSWTLTGEELVGLTLTPGQDWNGEADLSVTATATDSLTGTEATTTATLPLNVVDVFDVPPAPDVTLVSVNDWHNPHWGGGFNATFEMTVTEELLAGGSAENWTLDVGIADPGASFSRGWVKGFNGQVDFDPATGTFSSAGQNPNASLEPGDTLTFSVQVQGAGFDLEDFSFAFVDADLGNLPVVETDAAISASSPLQTDMTEAEFALALDAFTVEAEASTSPDDAVFDAAITGEPDEVTTPEPAPETTEVIPPPLETTIDTLQNL